MCMFNGEVKEVKNTKIFVSPLMDGVNQVTIYSNEVKLVGGRKNAMVLPIPNPTNQQDKIQLVSMENYPTIFNDLSKLFSEFSTKQKGFALRSNSQSYKTLEVVEVGSYSCSIVPSLVDFDRLDTGVFSLNPKLKNVLQEYYPSGYSFLVCKIKRSEKFHPIAYIHPKPANSLFVPTRHFHDEQNDGNNNSVNHPRSWGISQTQTPISWPPQAPQYSGFLYTPNWQPMHTNIAESTMPQTASKILTQDVARKRGDFSYAVPEFARDPNYTGPNVNAGYSFAPIKNRRIYTDHVDDWDHEIYSIGSIDASVAGKSNQDTYFDSPPVSRILHLHEFLDLEKLGPKVNIPIVIPAMIMRKRTIRGTAKNEDIIISIVPQN